VQPSRPFYSATSPALAQHARPTPAGLTRGVHSLSALSGSKVDDNTRRGVAPPAMPRRSPQGHSSQAAIVAGHAIAETASPG